MKYDMICWENGFKHDGLLYFNQRLQEMLSHFADHVYAVPVYNTQLLVGEYISTAKLVKDGVINEENLKFILTEFIESFRNDIIVSEHIDEEHRKEYIDKLLSASKDEKERVMRYIACKLRHYNEWCKEYLARIVPKESEKKKIEKALRCFIPGLIGAGYSREFIYFFNKKVFNETPVESLQSLDSFLDRFDYKEKEYTIYLAVKKRVKEYQNILEERLKVVFDVENEAADFYYNSKKYLMIKCIIKSLDERSALRDVIENLDLFFGFNTFQRDKHIQWFSNTAKIVDSQGVSSILKISDNEFCFEKTIENKQVGLFSEAVITHLMFNAPNAFQVIKRVTDIHNSALAEQDINNAFLRLWSIFEILFVSEHSDSKICEIEDKVIRILVPDYLCSLFGKIEEDIIDNLGVKSIGEIRDKIKSPDSKWIQAIVLLKDYSAERQELINLLADYPIVRSRICQIGEEFRTAHSISTIANRHTDRLKWHLRRLYRTRNAIIHSGTTPHGVKELLRHLHNYVDQCIDEIIFLLMTNRDINSIQSAIIEIKVRFELQQKDLNSKAPLTENTIPRMLFSPYR